MVTIARSRKNVDWVNDMVGAAIADVGTIHDRIVAARIRLGRRIRRAAPDAMPRTPKSAISWSPTRQRELERALDRWDNEGGARPPGRASPTTDSPAARQAGFSRYLNDIGVREIRIGATEFHCIGALPPHDHPHIYLNMEGKPDILCPYCATSYRYDERLQSGETEPEGCFYSPMANEIANPGHGARS